MPAIERLDVALTDVAHGARQRIALRRGQKEVDMVAHEYIGMNPDAVLVHRIAQQFVVMPAIFFIHKDGAAVYSALGDVEGSAREF
ncbi:hypothetical protein GCM10027065_26630 [Rhodanobacter koreensis]